MGIRMAKFWEAIIESCVLNDEFPFSKCFFEEKIVFSIKIIVILAFHNLFWFLNENPFRAGQISLKKIKFRENMWRTRYIGLFHLKTWGLRPETELVMKNLPTALTPMLLKMRPFQKKNNLMLFYTQLLLSTSKLVLNDEKIKKRYRVGDGTLLDSTNSPNSYTTYY